MESSGNLTKSEKSWISKAKMEPSWTNIGNKIGLMLKTAYGAEVLSFPIDLFDFRSPNRYKSIYKPTSKQKQLVRPQYYDFEGDLGANLAPSWVMLAAMLDHFGVLLGMGSGR